MRGDCLRATPLAAAALAFLARFRDPLVDEPELDGELAWSPRPVAGVVGRVRALVARERDESAASFSCCRNSCCASCLTLSEALFDWRLLCQTRFLPLPVAISSIERPVATDNDCSSKMSLPPGPRAASSLPLINSQLSWRSFGRARIRTKCQRPCSFSPSRSNIR